MAEALVLPKLNDFAVSESEMFAGLAAGKRFHTSNPEFWKLRLDGINFNGSDLDGLFIDECSLVNCDFRDCFLGGFAFAETIATDVRFDRAVMAKGSFSRCLFEAVSFRSANMIRVRFSATEFGTVDFSETNLTRACFDRCDLRNVDFGSAEMDDVYFFDCELSEATRAIPGIHIQGR